MKYILASCIFYTIGIFFNDKFTNLQFLSGILSLTLTIISINFISKKTSNIILVLVCLISSVFGGYWYLYRFPEKADNDLYYHSPQKNIVLEGTVISEPKLKSENFMIFNLKVQKVIEPSIFSTESKTQILLKYVEKLDIKYGDRLKISGNLFIPSDSPNPREFSYKKYLENDGIFTTLSVNTTKQIATLEKETIRDFFYYILKTKNKILFSLQKNMSKDSADFVGSLLLGSRASPVSNEIGKDFSDLQISHILAASGMQVSLIMMFGVFFVNTIRINKKLGFILISISIIFYMFLTSMPPSIFRAGIVGLIVLWAYLNKKKTNSINILITVCFLIILASPTLVYNVGLQFSMIATFGILYFSPILAKRLIFLPIFIAEFISIPISAFLFTFPLQVFYFSYFSYISLLTNIIASLFVIILTYGGILVLFIGKLGIFLEKFVILFLGFVSYLASFDLEAFVKRPTLTDLFFMYSLLFFIRESLVKIKINGLKKLYISILCVFVSLLITVMIRHIEKDLLNVTFINVGLGDSIFIQTPSKQNIMIDCGKSYEFFDENNKKITIDAGKTFIIPYLKHNGIKNIDLLVITHPDIDHYGGFNSISDEFEIKNVLINGQMDNNFLKIFEQIRKKNIALKIAKQGDSYLEKDLTFEVINNMNIENNFSKNDNSIVMKLIYKNTSFLFMGDLETEGENELLNSDINLTSDILKVSHHGSNSATSKEFLKMVKPRVSVISVGKNSYNLPSKDVLKRLKSFGSSIYRTDVSGGILITSDGEQLVITTSQ